MWDLRAELEGMSAAGELVRNALPMFQSRGIAGVPDGFSQIPALVERGSLTKVKRSPYKAENSLEFLNPTLYTLPNI